MSAETAFTYASILFCSWLVLARLFERTWVSPAVLFFFGFFAHAFIAPEIYDSLGAISPANLPFVYRFSVFSFLAAVAGYIFGQLMLTPRMRTVAVSSEISFAGYHSILLRYACIVLAAYLWLYVFVLSDVLNLPKGTDAYRTDFSVSERFGKLALLLPASIAAWYMFVSSKSSKSRGRKGFAWLPWLGCLGSLIAVNMLLQARQEIVTLLFFVGMYHHYRIKKLGLATVALLSLGLLGVQIVAQLRVLGAGIGQLRPSDIVSHVSQAVGMGGFAMMESLLSSLPGQQVFVEVVDLVGPTGHKWGLTYLQSLGGLGLPSFLGFHPLWETPASWFHNEFAPDVEHHGFDFSALSEAYLNFGHWGPLVFLFFGFAVALASWAIRRSRSFSSVLLGLIVIVGLTFGLRHDSFAMFKGLFYTWFGVWLLAKTGVWVAQACRQINRSVGVVGTSRGEIRGVA